jgi:hypothetical protein
MHDKFDRELLDLHLAQPAPPAAPVTDADLVALPAPVQRYMRFMGVVGKERVWSLRVGFEGRFKLRPAAGWARCKTIQYNSADELARVFFLKLRMALVPMIGRDTYLHGKGRLVGRAFDLFTVVDGSGPEFDTSELVTFLDDAVLMAPSMLLGLRASFTSVDDDSFDVSLTDHGTTVTARVFLDERGAPRDFSTTDRYLLDDAGQYVRTRWTTPVEGWTEIAGRKVPASAQAVWQPEGAPPFAYAEFRILPEHVAFNIAPGARPRRKSSW